MGPEVLNILLTFKWEVGSSWWSKLRNFKTLISPGQECHSMYMSFLMTFEPVSGKIAASISRTKIPLLKNHQLQSVDTMVRKSLLTSIIFTIIDFIDNQTLSLVDYLVEVIKPHALKEFRPKLTMQDTLYDYIVYC